MLPDTSIGLLLTRFPRPFGTPSTNLLPRRDSRKDWRLRSVVNFGLALQRSGGLHHALRYMKEQQVPLHVALRVLLKRPLR